MYHYISTNIMLYIYIYIYEGWPEGSKPYSYFSFRFKKSFWLYIYIYIYIYEGWSKNSEPYSYFSFRFKKSFWFESYSCWKQTRQSKFKSWNRMFAFHMELISQGKAWIQLFSLQLCINIRVDWALWPLYGNQSKRKKTLNSNQLNTA